jgi:hypothetical protein
MPGTLHGRLIGLISRAIQLLPRSVRGALDAWSQRVARRRALRRQRTGRRPD